MPGVHPRVVRLLQRRRIVPVRRRAERRLIAPEPDLEAPRRAREEVEGADDAAHAAVRVRARRVVHRRRDVRRVADDPVVGLDAAAGPRPPHRDVAEFHGLVEVDERPARALLHRVPDLPADLGQDHHLDVVVLEFNHLPRPLLGAAREPVEAEVRVDPADDGDRVRIAEWIGGEDARVLADGRARGLRSQRRGGARGDDCNAGGQVAHNTSARRRALQATLRRGTCQEPIEIGGSPAALRLAFSAARSAISLVHRAITTADCVRAAEHAATSLAVGATSALCMAIAAANIAALADCSVCGAGPAPPRPRPPPPPPPPPRPPRPAPATGAGARASTCALNASTSGLARHRASPRAREPGQPSRARPSHRCTSPSSATRASPDRPPASSRADRAARRAAACSSCRRRSGAPCSARRRPRRVRPTDRCDAARRHLPPPPRPPPSPIGS